MPTLFFDWWKSSPRPKSNSNPARSGFLDIAPIPVNEGVISDELVAPTGCWKSDKDNSPAISAALRFRTLPPAHHMEGS